MHMRTVIALLVAIAASGCGHSTVTPPLETPAGTERTANDSPTRYIHLNVQPEKERKCKAKNKSTECTDNKFESINGPYYIRITGYWVPSTLNYDGTLVNIEIGRPDYDKDQRNGWARFVAGKNRSFSLIANIGVENHLNYKTTVPLYSVSHVSNGEGESFDVNVKDAWVSPLIRVTSDTRLTTEVLAKRTDEVKTGAVSAVLRVAQTAAEQIAPAGKLLTLLNQDQVKKESKVWDKAIGDLFGQSAAENRGGTTPTGIWKNGETAVISLQSPALSDALMPAYFGGSWIFGITETRVSLFSANPCLKEEVNSSCVGEVIKSVAPQTVLNETVGEKTSLIGALRKQEWYAVMVNAIGSEAKNGGGKKQNLSAGQFCRQVVQNLDDLGLAPIDAKLALWAIQQNEPLTADVLAAIKKNVDCQSMISPFTFEASKTYKVERPEDPADPAQRKVQ